MIQQGQQLALALFHCIAKRLDGKLKTPIKTFFLSLITGALYRERHEDVVFGLPQFCQPQRAQRTHKEHKDTQAQGFVYFVHPLCTTNV